MHLKSVALVFVLTVCLIAQAAQASSLPEFSELAATCGPAVVNINTEKTTRGGQVGPEDFFGEMFRHMPPGFENFFGPRGKGGQARPQQPKSRQKSLGSGFLISADGYIVTNNHVVADADIIRVTLDEKIYKGEPVKAELIGADEETDLALLKISVKKDLPFLKFGSSESLKVGEWVLAIGNPFGLDHSVTAGILSAKGRRINAGAFDNFLQTDASINPGNSGGPLINMKGEVIGINTAIIASGQGIGFAIPSDMANDIIGQIKSGKQVSRGWIGVSIQSIDENTAKALGLANTKGALVGSVQPGQPADQAGMKDGDVIINIDGQDVADSDALLRIIAGKRPGTECTMKVVRDGETKTLKVTLGDRSENMKAEGSGHGASAKKADAILGLSVKGLSSEEAKRLDVAGGVRIVDINPDKAAASKLRVGDIITKVNRTKVKSVADYSEAVKKAASNGAILLQVSREGQRFFVTIDLSDNN